MARTLRPPPLELSGHIFWGNFFVFLEVQKSSFFLSSEAFYGKSMVVGTVYPRSLDSCHLVTYNIKWARTSQTYCIVYPVIYILLDYSLKKFVCADKDNFYSKSLKSALNSTVSIEFSFPQCWFVLDFGFANDISDTFQCQGGRVRVYII